MATAFIDIKGKCVGASSGELDISPTQIAITSAVGLRHSVALGAGSTTVTVPTGSTYVLITPPTSNIQAITLKGVAGDTGVAIAKTKPTLLSLDTVTTFVLSCITGGFSVECTYL
jgi:hypothetical protein